MSSRSRHLTFAVSLVILGVPSLACFVPDDGDGSSGSSGASESSDAGTGVDDTSGEPAPYAACPSGSDVQCGPFYLCIDDIATCTAQCIVDQDCPAPEGGTSFQRCEQLDGELGGSCVLFCGDGSQCPDAMTCMDIVNADGETVPICVWP